jgi:hypothetical protein
VARAVRIAWWIEVMRLNPHLYTPHEHAESYRLEDEIAGEWLRWQMRERVKFFSLFTKEQREAAAKVAPKHLIQYPSSGKQLDTKELHAT